MTCTDLIRATRNRAILPLSMLSVASALITFLGGACPAFAQTAQAQTLASDTTQAQTAAQPQAAQLQEVEVTGTRIVRNGYEAPTPVSVISADELQNAATSNIADYIDTLPAISSSLTPETNASRVNNASEGVNDINLRALGDVRTLVLMDGQRVGGSLNTGVADISEIPQQLISRIDVVTGGASAAYGSDALSGVVNFIMDNNFTGLKGEVSGGETTYSDDRNWKTDLTYGTGFADNRGHLIISGEDSLEDGVLINNRPWNSEPGWGYMTNPAYTPTNGLPQDILLPNVGLSNATLGGEIACTKTSACAPLRGIAFGPGGVPYNVAFGPVVSDPLMSGGSWQNSYMRDRYAVSLQPAQNRQNLFTRASYDVGDDWNVYGQVSWSHLHTFSYSAPDFYAGNLTVQANNAFIPSSVATEIAQLGISSFAFGTMNGDLPEQNDSLDRHQQRFVLGTNGTFTAFGTSWKVSAYLESALARINSLVTTLDVPNYMQAINAVKGPNGAIVCASTLTNPTNGCVPYNLFGTGVNNQAAVNYVTGTPFQDDRFLERVESANITGDPFSDWAGPISIATGIEHREESASGISDPFETTATTWFFGAGAPAIGNFTVTEGYVETVVPLAKNVAWAKSLDLNAAIRGTGYDTGPVATWKAGAEYSPVADVRFRATRSRDIREPTLNDLYAGASISQNFINDPYNGNALASYRGLSTGNPKLVPEDANSTGLGVVFQPSFLPGFNASFDYYAIDITNAIESLSAQQLISGCFAGNQTLCSLTQRSTVNGVDSFTINIAPVNLAREDASGFDIETSYPFNLQNIVSSWSGTVALRVLATHFINDTLYPGIVGVIPTQNVGQNGGNGPPHWRYLAQINYLKDPLTFALTMRGISSGVYSNANIQCTSGCPTSTALNPTVSDNQMAGAIYFDFDAAYKLGGAAELFFNVRNLTNRDPAVYGPGPTGTPYNSPNANPVLYDVLGRVYRVGLRFKM